MATLLDALAPLGVILGLIVAAVVPGVLARWCSRDPQVSLRKRA